MLTEIKDESSTATRSFRPRVDPTADGARTRSGGDVSARSNADWWRRFRHPMRLRFFNRRSSLAGV